MFCFGVGADQCVRPDVGLEGWEVKVKVKVKVASKEKVPDVRRDLEDPMGNPPSFFTKRM